MRGALIFLLLSPSKMQVPRSPGNLVSALAHMRCELHLSWCIEQATWKSCMSCLHCTCPVGWLTTAPRHCALWMCIATYLSTFLVLGSSHGKPTCLNLWLCRLALFSTRAVSCLCCKHTLWPTKEENATCTVTTSKYSLFFFLNICNVKFSKK